MAYPPKRTPNETVRYELNRICTESICDKLKNWREKAKFWINGQMFSAPELEDSAILNCQLFPIWSVAPIRTLGSDRNVGAERQKAEWPTQSRWKHP